MMRLTFLPLLLVGAILFALTIGRYPLEVGDITAFFQAMVGLKSMAPKHYQLLHNISWKSACRGFSARRWLGPLWRHPAQHFKRCFAIRWSRQEFSAFSVVRASARLWEFCCSATGR
jgi:hypothetical protein